MTKETIKLIIKWFARIQQLATDRKTYTKVTMDRQHCLKEIAAMASNCKQFVVKYQYEQEPINEEELELLAKSYDIPIYGDAYSDEEWDQIKYLVEEAYKAGYRKGYKDKVD